MNQNHQTDIFRLSYFEFFEHLYTQPLFKVFDVFSPFMIYKYRTTSIPAYLAFTATATDRSAEKFKAGNFS